MVPESRIVASLLLRRIRGDDWKQAIEVENLLRKRSPTTASTAADLIRNRLNTMSAGLWKLVRDGSSPVATHAVFAATLKFSPLVGDFLDLVVRDLYKRFEPTLKPQYWDRYIEDCHSRDPGMPEWTASTQGKLRTRAFGMLTEAGYITDSRSRALRSVNLSAEVISYLQEAGERYVLRCMQVNP